MPRVVMKTARTDLDHTRSLLANTGFEFVPEIIPELIEQGIREDLPTGTSSSSFLHGSMMPGRNAV